MLLPKRLKLIIAFIAVLVLFFVLVFFSHKSKEEKSTNETGLPKEEALAAEISKRFFTTVNKTDKPDFYVNGIIVHGYDRWTSWKPLSFGKKIGSVASSYLRKDISIGNPRPVYFEQSTTEGIILKPLSKLEGKNKYQVLCFYPTDAESGIRRYSSCGAFIYENLASRFAKFKNRKFLLADLQTTVYKINNNVRFIKLKNSDFLNPTLVTEKTPQITTSFDANFNNGCKKAGIDSVGKFFATYNFSSTGVMEKMQCSFGATKKYFDLGLRVERELLRRYKNHTSLYGKRWNEVVVREWSYLEDKSAPVEAIYYLYADKNHVYKKMSKEIIKKSIKNAKKWQKEIYEETGKIIPILRLDMDVVTGVKKSKKVVTYHKSDNLKF